MKKLVFLIIVSFLLLPKSSAQQSNEKTVTLVVNGSGNTKEDATKNALRSAIEQAFGTFVSTNTKILNDELIKDEIVTVSTGNIKTYKELSSIKTDFGYEVSVQATVSIDQLTKFAQGKGMQTELAGASFVMNMKIRELNKKNEYNAIQHMFEKVKLMGNNSLFDYQLKIDEPQLVNGSTYRIKVSVFFCENENTIAFYNMVYSTVNELSLTPTEVNEYRKIGIEMYFYDRQLKPVSRTPDWKELEAKEYYGLRNNYSSDNSISIMMQWLIDEILHYNIKDNLGNIIHCHYEKVMNPKFSDSTPIAWDFTDDNNIHRYYIFSPSNRIGRIEDQRRFRSLHSIRIHNYYGDGILALDDRDSNDDHYLTFNPMIKDWYTPNWRLQERKNSEIYFQQEFYLIYSEEELSRLKYITIEHRKN